MVTDWGEWKEKPPEKPTEKPKAEPKLVKHLTTAKIAFCPECSDVHISDDLADLIKAGNIAGRLQKKFPEMEYLCANCKIPLAKTSDDAKNLKGCWFCGGQKAVRRGK